MSLIRTIQYHHKPLPFEQDFHISDEFRIQVHNPELLQVIGVLRASWYNNRGELVSFNYGTAFAIAPKIIVTCTHNIYSESREQMAKEIIFLPNPNFNNPNPPTYKCTQREQIKNRIPTKSFAYSPLEEQLTLLGINDGQQISATSFIKLGSLQSSIDHLQIIGYPSQQYRRIRNLQEIFPKRQVLKGKLYSLNNHVIHHTLKTKIGYSGSPIITRTPQGQYYATGIHTHRGTKIDFNSGLYFSSNILKQIQIMVKDLSKYYGRKFQTIFQFQNEINMAEYYKAQVIPPPHQIGQLQDLDNMDALECILGNINYSDMKTSHQNKWTQSIQVKNLQKLSGGGQKKEVEKQQKQSLQYKKLTQNRKELSDIQKSGFREESQQKSQEQFSQSSFLISMNSCNSSWHESESCIGSEQSQMMLADKEEEKMSLDKFQLKYV